MSLVLANEAKAAYADLADPTTPCNWLLLTAGGASGRRAELAAFGAGGVAELAASSLLQPTAQLFGVFSFGRQESSCAALLSFVGAECAPAAHDAAAADERRLAETLLVAPAGIVACVSASCAAELSFADLKAKLSAFTRTAHIELPGDPDAELTAEGALQVRGNPPPPPPAAAAAAAAAAPCCCSLSLCACCLLHLARLTLAPRPCCSC